MYVQLGSHNGMVHLIDYKSNFYQDTTGELQYYETIKM